MSSDHTVGMIEFSCADVARVSRFWSTVLGLAVDDGASADYAQLTPPEPLPKWLFLRREPSGGSQSLIIAITSDDLEDSERMAVDAGATSHGHQDLDGFRWVDLEDPEGNRFTFNAPPPA